jgi:hypothetical protein
MFRDHFILDKDMEISFERTDYLKTHLILNTISHLETIVNENYLHNFDVRSLFPYPCPELSPNNS